ncbi:S-adenosylmethionine:tRNA ribosyltransferase-isomerase [Buchnera aphidicola]|uniref:S-adenosylmethionine:tRNA ribosyltransferase-isomerase n=1 Tax=Buchnera aphidicola TaxID=9 RepID=UPI00031BCFAE|nr:S-adenosylmethionine:tRNA ribosyltransferase-isomerase [Buchnera aphidicola]
MQLSDFSFDLPKSLISFHPYFIRSTCRLMVMYGHTGMIFHKRFFNIIDEINSGDLIILNNTQVIPARFLEKKKAEVKLKFWLKKY